MSPIPIYATLAWGFGPETWGAVGFSVESVRNSLADDLRKKGGLVLTIGTQGDETAPEDQGRLLGLHQLGTMPIRTEELVEPGVWRTHLRDNGGVPKWPFGLPIISADRFDDPPRRRDLLPRLHAENLHRKLASNYEELTDDEAAAILALARTPVAAIWSTPTSAFATRWLGRAPTGPRPSPGVRILSAHSGPAATYCFVLEGSALAMVASNVAPLGSGLKIYKVGFSNDPERRRSELNAYLPDNLTLEWRPVYAEWHTDEINAWAMEQEVFRRLRMLDAQHVKGEIFTARPKVLDSTWHTAVSTTLRPAGPVEVAIGREEKISPDAGG
jgi:hypothetical protein